MRKGVLMHITTAEEIVEFLKSKNIQTRGLFVSDDDFLCPSFEWVKKDFAKYWEKYKFDRQLTKYIPERRDCDNFALMAMTEAKFLHQKTKNNKDILADLAFGEIFYTRDKDMVSHAVNCFFYYNDDSKLDIGFFEPQNSKIMNFTEFETESIWYLRL